MKGTKRIFLLALCTLFAAMAMASALHAGAGKSIKPAPVNPDFLQYLENLRNGTAAGRFPPKAYL